MLIQQKKAINISLYKGTYLILCLALKGKNAELSSLFSKKKIRWHKATL